MSLTGCSSSQKKVYPTKVTSNSDITLDHGKALLSVSAKDEVIGLYPSTVREALEADKSLLLTVR